MLHEKKRLRLANIKSKHPFAGNTAPVTMVQIPQQLQHGDRQSARALRIRPFPIGTHKIMHRTENFAKIIDYLGHYVWDIPVANTSGATWMELLARDK